MPAWLNSPFTPLIPALLGLLLGFLFERFFLSALLKLTGRTRWQGDVIVVQSAKGLTFSAFTLTGIYLAVMLLKPGKDILFWAERVFAASITFILTLFILRLSSGFMKLYLKRFEDAYTSTSLFLNILKIVIFLIGLVVMLQFLGIPIAPIITTLGVGGLAVALAMQDTLSNLFAGIMIIVSRQIKPGDYIKLDSGEEGFVKDINWKNSSIRSLQNSLIYIPNIKLASAKLTNFSLPAQGFNFTLQISISPESDLDHVEQITLEVARTIQNTTEGAVKEFEPSLRYHTLNDFRVDFSIAFSVKDYTAQYLLKHNFIKALLKRYHEENINIPMPVSQIVMKDR